MEQKSYKEKLSQRKMLKRGQTTIFIVIAIVVVAAVVIAYFLLPTSIRGSLGPDLNPNNFLRECIEPSIQETVEELSMKGGYLNPEGTVLYQGEEIKYLCYTSEYYETCAVQQPLLVQHIESEIESVVSARATECSRELIEAYEGRGYDVSGSGSGVDVELVPNAIRANFDLPLRISKEDDVRNYDGFEINLRSNFYELVLTSQSIISFEASYGDSEITTYIQYYPNLKIEKIKLGDGTTIYTVSDVTTEETFRFASRSLVWPPGLGN